MAARFWVGGSGTWDASDTSHWAATSGGASGASVPGSGDTVTLDGSSGGGTVTVNTNVNVTSITMGAFTGTLDFATNNNTVTLVTFSGSGTGTRTLNQGSGQWTITGNNGSIWGCGDLTNATFNFVNPVNLTYSGSTGIRTIGHGGTAGGTEARAVSFNITAGTDTITTSGGSLVGSLDFTGFAGTLTNNARTLYGSLTVSTGMTLNAGSNVQTFASTSGVKTITCNGKTLDFPLTFNGVGGTWKPVGTFTQGSTRLFTVTNGTWDNDGNTVSVGLFNSSNSNTRTLVFSGVFNITGNNGTVLNMGVMTNLTLTQTGTINCTYSGSTGSRAIVTASSVNGSTESNVPSLNITAGTDTLTFSTARQYRSLNFTGFSGSLTLPAGTFYGSLTFSSTMTYSAAVTTFTFAATSGTHTITSAGLSLPNNITINGVGGTLQLGDSITLQGAVTLTNGTFNTSNFNVTSTLFSSNNSNTRSISLGSSTVTLNSTGTVWNVDSTNLTLDAGTSRIVLNNASASSKTFAGGAGTTYYDIEFAGAGTGTFILGTSTAAMSVHDLIVTTPPHTLQFFAGKTITVTGDFDVSGTSTNKNTLESTSSGTQWYLVKSSGTVRVQGVSIQDSNASGGAEFVAYGSIDAGNNDGWTFFSVANQHSAVRDGNYVPSLIAVLKDDGDTIIPVCADATSHSLCVEDDTTGSDLGPTNALRDQNYVPVLMAVSSVDGVTPVAVYATVDGKLLIDSN